MDALDVFRRRWQPLRIQGLLDQLGRPPVSDAPIVGKGENLPDEEDSGLKRRDFEPATLFGAEAADLALLPVEDPVVVLAVAVPPSPSMP